MQSRLKSAVGGDWHENESYRGFVGSRTFLCKRLLREWFLLLPVISRSVAEFDKGESVSADGNWPTCGSF